MGGILKFLGKSSVTLAAFGPSLRVSTTGICEPVTTTGLPKWDNMKLNALAVYDRVSVPCNTTNPSKSV